MKKLLILSLLIGFQNSKGMNPLGTNGETSSNIGTHLKPTYTIITSDEENFSKPTCTTDSPAQKISSCSNYKMNSSNQKKSSKSIHTTTPSVSGYLPKEAFHDSKTHKNGWNDLYITMLLNRHVRNETNKNKTVHKSTAHKSSDSEEINL